MLTGLGEGWLASSYVWHDLARAGVEIEPLLFVAAGLLVLAVTRGRRLSRSGWMRLAFLFSALSLFAMISRAGAALGSPVALLAAIAGASLVSLAWVGAGPAALQWQKRSLPVLLLLASWCVFGFPLKQQRHEQRELARLPAPAAGHPNVLIIVVDALRADHLSTYGYSRLTSPYLTQLAAEGTLFKNAIAPSSWTLPVHASILTGLDPDAHHVDSDGSMFGWRYPTLSEAFMARGYRTAAFSGNTFLFCRQRGFGRGFIHFEDEFQTWGSGFAQTFYGDLIKHMLFRLRWKRDLFGRRRAADINLRALRWIDGNSRPFFVFLNYFDAHDPYLPPEPYLHRYTARQAGSRASEHWEWFEHLTPAQRQGALDAYDGSINYVDDQLHELMQQLAQRGLDRNTLVVVTSDHGESFGEHDLMVHGSGLYRELIHVPLVLWRPGVIPAGKKVDAPVSLTSIPATLLEEAGERVHPNFPQLSALRRGGAAGQGNGPGVVSELAQLRWNPRFPNYDGPLESVTTASWHYIHGGKFHDELFTCCDRGEEQLNLADTVVGRGLIGQLRQEIASSAHVAWGALPHLSPERPASSYHVQFHPVELALGDFDADGNVDIAVRGARNEIALLLGNGRGQFRPSPHVGDYSSTSSRRKALLAGVRLETACRSAQGPTCTLPTASSPSSGSFANPLRARFADLNGDGVKDVVIRDLHGGVESRLIAEGAGKLRLTGVSTVSKARLSTGDWTSVAQGDLDGNGIRDFAILDADHASVTFLVAVSPGNFVPAKVPVSANSVAIALSDLNRDGRADLVTISDADDSVTVY